MIVAGVAFVVAAIICPLLGVLVIRDLGVSRGRH